MANNSLTCHMTNEKRLIDANALFKAIKSFRWFGNTPPNTLKLMFDYLRIIINEQPTVDAVEVVHGEWSTIEDDYCGLVALHCSVCNNEWWFEEDAPIKHYHYCPNCGAKMDGDGNG